MYIPFSLHVFFQCLAPIIAVTSLPGKARTCWSLCGDDAGRCSDESGSTYYLNGHQYLPAVCPCLFHNLFHLEIQIWNFGGFFVCLFVGCFICFWLLLLLFYCFLCRYSFSQSKCEVNNFRNLPLLSN